MWCSGGCVRDIAQRQRTRSKSWSYFEKMDRHPRRSHFVDPLCRQAHLTLILLRTPQGLQWSIIKLDCCRTLANLQKTYPTQSEKRLDKLQKTAPNRFSSTLIRPIEQVRVRLHAKCHVEKRVGTPTRCTKLQGWVTQRNPSLQTPAATTNRSAQCPRC